MGKSIRIQRVKLIHLQGQVNFNALKSQFETFDTLRDRGTLHTGYIGLTLGGGLYSGR